MVREPECVRRHGDPETRREQEGLNAGPGGLGWRSEGRLG